MKKLLIYIIMICTCLPNVVLAEEHRKKSSEQIAAEVEELSEKFLKEVQIQFSLDELIKVELALPPLRVPGEFGEKQWWLEKEEKAPWAGLLLNPEAASYVLSEYEAVQERANAALLQQRELDLLKLNLEVGKLSIDLATLEESVKIKLQAKDRELERYRKINEELRNDRSGFRKKLLIGSGSAIVGIAGGIILGLFILN